MIKINFKKTIKYFLRIIFILFLPLATYLVAVLILGITPINTSYTQPTEGVDIYIKSNGVHTDIVVPVSNEIFDWSTKIIQIDFNQSDKEYEYISFGWGDKGFYLYTPTWADLKFSTAFKAMFWLSTSAMHVSYLDYTPMESDKIKKIRISKEKYKILAEYIDKSFQKNTNNQCILIPSFHYEGMNDNFYEALGTYNLFKTCNCWTNTGLKEAGVQTGIWTPFEWAIMYHRK